MVRRGTRRPERMRVDKGIRWQSTSGPTPTSLGGEFRQGYFETLWLEALPQGRKLPHMAKPQSKPHAGRERPLLHSILENLVAQSFASSGARDIQG